MRSQMYPEAGRSVKLSQQLQMTPARRLIGMNPADGTSMDSHDFAPVCAYLVNELMNKH
jgi:hypothetical protein